MGGSAQNVLKLVKRWSMNCADCAPRVADIGNAYRSLIGKPDCKKWRGAPYEYSFVCKI
jgi:hypothetical protein